MFWHQSGSLTPYANAVHERALRLKLEEFRNWASARYLADPKLTKDEIKDEWINAELKPGLRSDQLKDDAKSLIVAISAMGEEMFVGLAARRRKEYIDLQVAAAKSEAKAIWDQQRVKALRT
nr:hypothetical protein [Rhizobium sp. ACO-34A]